MAIGLGIHGEPGIDETDIPTADGLAELLVAKLPRRAAGRASTRSRGARVVPILNGLGSLKYEELFVVYRRVAQLLDRRGHRARRPARRRVLHELRHGRRLAHPVLARRASSSRACGTTPVDTPAYRRGSVAPHGARRMPPPRQQRSPTAIQPGDDDVPRRRPTVLAAVARPSPTRSTRTSTSSAASTRSPATATTASACSAARTPPLDAADAAVDAGAGAGTILARAADALVRQGRRHVRRAVGRHPDRDRRRSSATRAAPTRIRRRVRRRRGHRGASRDYGKAEVGDKTHGRRARAVQRSTLTREVDAGASLADAWRDGAADAATGRRRDRRPAAPHGPRPHARPEQRRHARPGRASRSRSS